MKKRDMLMLTPLALALNGALLFAVDVSIGAPWPVASVVAPICTIAGLGMILVAQQSGRRSPARNVEQITPEQQRLIEEQFAVVEEQAVVSEASLQGLIGRIPQKEHLVVQTNIEGARAIRMAMCAVRHMLGMPKSEEDALS